MDLHDHPVLQAEAVGLPLSGRRRGELDRLTSDNIEAFERVIVVSSTFGDLAGVPAAKRLVIPNGTDTTAVRPGQWPARHRVGFVSGAAPGRGIELLIDAMNILRLEHSATLALGLVATSTETGSYLAHLKRSHAHQDWIAIHTVPYRELGSFLADCSVLVIPHPAGAYMDSALPVKLFDSMAAGRPLVVTPRTETVRVVTQAGAGVACESDSAESLAAALSECLTDIPRSQEMGRRGRQAAEQLYDWRILSAKVADEFLSG